MVYQILKIIYKIGEDDWRTKDNTKLKYLEVAGGVKKKLEKGIKKKRTNRRNCDFHYIISIQTFLIGQ